MTGTPAPNLTGSPLRARRLPRTECYGVPPRAVHGGTPEPARRGVAPSLPLSYRVAEDETRARSAGGRTGRAKK